MNWLRFANLLAEYRRVFIYPVFLVFSIKSTLHQSIVLDQVLNESRSHISHRSPCANDSDQVIINLGSIYHRSVNCLVFCSREKSVGLFECQTDYWKLAKIRVWQNASLLKEEFVNCTHHHYHFDLCRIPVIIESINAEGSLTSNRVDRC